MEYYYTPKCNINETLGELIITGSEFKHLTRVLKKNITDKINVTDGELNIYSCLIKAINTKELICEILEKRYNTFEPKIKLTLGLSLLKNSDRYEFAVEKAVELGVSEIIPVITDYTINKSGLSDLKIQRLNSIALSAMKQSQRCFLPVVQRSMDFKELLKKADKYDVKILMYESAESQFKIENRNLKNNCLLLIGPEGGFSEREVSEMKNNNWMIHSLGDRKYRAETAAIISVYQIISNSN
jgi:16S rRNA (uracil1498-N3)-methyltransferase